MNSITSSALSALLNSEAAAPLTLRARQIVQATYVGGGFVAVDGCKYDVILDDADRKQGLPELNYRAEVFLVDRDAGDPLAEEGGGLVASFVKAADWRRLEAAAANGEAVEGKLVFHVRKTGNRIAGYKVRVGSVVGFLPLRALRELADRHERLNTTMLLDITAINAEENSLVFTVKSALDARKNRIEEVEIGAVLSGTVAKILDFGALVNIGNGACGLVHKSEYIRGVTLKVGDVIDVVVLSKDAERGRMALSYKKGVRRAFARQRVVGTEYGGTVVAVKPYGIFVEVEPGIVGLIHSSRLGGKDYDAESVRSSLPNPLRVRLMTTDADGERIDFALA